MDTNSAAVAAIATLALTMAGLSGYLVATPGGPAAANTEAPPSSADPTAEAVNQSRDLHDNGSLSFVARNATWVDIGFLATNSTPLDAVRFRVDFLWKDQGWGDRTQRIACVTLSRRINGSTARPQNGGIALTCPDNSIGPDDGAFEANVEYEGTGVGVDAPHPAWPAIRACRLVQDQCFGAYRFQRTFTLEDAIAVDYGMFVNDSDREVLHWRFFTGAFAPDRTAVQVAWNGTVVNVTHGDGDDAFWYFREDFEHGLYARADASPMGPPAVARDGVLETELVNSSDRNAFFIYSAQVWGASSQAPYGLVRPNGSEWSSVDPNGANEHFAIESTNQTGTWRFWYDRERTGHPQWDHRDDHPLIFGFRSRWAEMPWGES